MATCGLMRGVLTKNGSWGWTQLRGPVSRFVCQRLQKHFCFYFSFILLVVPCHTIIECVSLFVWTVGTLLCQSVLLSNNNSTTMSTHLRFKCSQCNQHKLSSEYGMCQRDDKNSLKGACFSVCLSCSTANSAKWKQRHTKSNFGYPAKQPAPQHATPSGQLTEASTKHSSASEIYNSWHISLDHHPVDWFAIQPCTLPTQFMEDLTKYASAAKIVDSWLVSVNKMALTDKEVANQLASLAWKVTGYRFK